MGRKVDYKRITKATQKENTEKKVKTTDYGKMENKLVAEVDF